MGAIEIHENQNLCRTTSAQVIGLWFATPTRLDALAKECQRLSPYVFTRRDRAIFIKIDPSSIQHSEKHWENRVRVLLRKVQLKARIGIGSGISDSLVRAKFNTADLGSLPLGSLLDFADPLDQEPFTKKSVLQLITALQELGVHTLAQFQKIPPADLSARFGPVGTLCGQRVQGDAGFRFLRT